MIVAFNLRLMPLLIMVASIAFLMKAVNIYTGMNVLTQPALAAEEPAAPPEDSEEAKPAKDDGKAEGGADPAAPDAATSQPGPIDTSVILGLPSDEQLRLLTSLRERSASLDKRERLLDLRDQTLAATEQNIERRIEALKELEEQVRSHLRIFDEQEAAQLDSVVQVYETMPAKQAAPRFELLEIDVQVDLATRMSNRKFALMLAKMSPQAAKELTTKLAKKAKAPTLEDIQSGR